MKKLLRVFMVTAVVLSLFTISCEYEEEINPAEYQTIDLTNQSKLSQSCGISLVKLMGKINYFGYDITQTPPVPIDYHATVQDVKVWIAEYSFTKYFDIKSDETGWWTIYVIKYEGIDIDLSLVYEKEGWVTTKSNVITVTDDDNLDMAIQFIDPLYYYHAIKPGVEQQLSDIFGFPIIMENAMVVTVGKSWASMHDDRLPHGDPGATVSLSPLVPAFGPIYFNEYVVPDPTYTSTSVDGGVTWVNVPQGSYTITAEKESVDYDEVRFNVEESDVDNGIILYIASPPDSVQGTNDSGPGEY